MKNENRFMVYAGWLDEPELIGTLYNEINARGTDVLYFEYSEGWLAEHLEIILDPDLLPYTGRQYLMSGKSNFGFLSDASPDRWGRLLMKRREVILAREQDRSIRNLSEIDYLLGVHDVGRIGGLRFKAEPDGDFLSNDKAMAAPPWVQLRGLQNASLMLESSGNPYEKKWLLQLLAPGSSLGGARPKATVQDEHGNLPFHSDKIMNRMCADIMCDMFGDDVIEYIAWDTQSSDIGDLSSVIPVIQPLCCGATGNQHGEDYYIADKEKCLINPTKVISALVYDLLKDDAKEAVRVKESYRPLYKSKEDYFRTIDAIEFESELVQYNDDRTITLNFHNPSFHGKDKIN